MPHAGVRPWNSGTDTHAAALPDVKIGTPVDINIRDSNVKPNIPAILGENGSPIDTAGYLPRIAANIQHSCQCKAPCQFLCRLNIRPARRKLDLVLIEWLFLANIPVNVTACYNACRY